MRRKRKISRFFSATFSLVLVISSTISACNVFAEAAYAEPFFTLPKYRIKPNELAVIVNQSDPLSVKISNYYRQARHIPSENIIYVAFDSKRQSIPPDEFDHLYRNIKARTLQRVQAYALTWAEPYRVGCMSISSAIAMGYDNALCAKPACRTLNKTQPYFDSPSTQPFADYNMRPTMAIAARNFKEAKTLIDRGIAADASTPTGTAYLVSTSDKARNVRSAQYKLARQIVVDNIRVEILKTDTLQNKQDVLFYFTGLKAVSGFDSLRFIPGAIADHLTSTGGQLTDSRQMSALRWLEAGATGSYGTVVEPCNYPAKFPTPGAVMTHYLHGATLIEAYWKSVMWPHEGIYIGEPLSAPYAGYRVERRNKRIFLHTRALMPGRYVLQSSASILGPYRDEPFVLDVKPSDTVHEIPDFGERAYSLVRTTR